MTTFKKITTILFFSFLSSAAFSQALDSAATVKLVARAWAPDSVTVNNQKQDTDKSAGAKLAFNKDFSVTSTNPDGSEEQGSWKYDASSNQITMTQGDDETATIVFKIVSVTDKNLVLAMTAEGLNQAVKIYLSPAKE